MENKTRSRVMLAITLFSAIVLSGTVFVCARRAGEEVTQRSFDELTAATKELAKDINNVTRMDQTILSAMAELIAGQDEDDLDSVLRYYQRSRTHGSSAGRWWQAEGRHAS